ncbi:MAG: AfsR/SARP family transcriptional regulator, partial [Acidimicrobiales bacterium]
ALALVNLEALGLVCVEGEPAATEAVVRSMVLELATSSWADYFEVVSVGFGPPPSGLERVRPAGDLDELMAAMGARAREARAVRAAAGWSSTLSPRVDAGGCEQLAPVVVLCSSEMLDGHAAALLDATTPPGSTVCAVVAGPLEGAPVRLALDGGEVWVEPLGVKVRPQPLGLADLEAAEDVVATATRRADVRTPVGDDRAYAGRLLHVVEGGADLPAPPAEVEVQVLGPVQVPTQGEWKRAKSAELVAYLALHPRGVDHDQLCEALWPNQSPAGSTLHSTVSVARTALGQSASGEPHLPPVRAGRYGLAPSVATDWSRFQALSRAAESTPGYA